MLYFSLQSDHLEFATHHYFFKLLQVENLLLQLGLGFLQVAYHLLIGAHVAKDTNRPDHSAIGIAPGRDVARRPDNLPGVAARIEARNARSTDTDHLAQRSPELAGL